ncbi:MAG: hypothetical protein ACE5GW_11690, partial [Planctomycetota bacterium]
GLTADTDSGELRDSSGALLLGAASGTGEFQFTLLRLPEGVTLRATGANPLIMRVSGLADIAGTIDVSGEDGGIPDLADPQGPQPGAGGLAGAGGGAGGGGGSTRAAGLEEGHAGEFPPSMPLSLIDDDPPYGGGGPGGGPLPVPLAWPAEGGETVEGDAGCSAGAAGGGGHAVAGDDGSTILNLCGIDGGGGSIYGATLFLVPDPQDPEDSIELLVGGAGGGGGGGHHDAATQAESPGSGGGGGGGFIELTAGGPLFIRAGAAFLARGGNAFMAPENAGNGGGGAGGAIRLRGGSLTVLESGPEGGPLFDVTGGSANVDPSPLNPGYAPNLQPSAGHGGHGRIRIESALGFSTGGESLDVAPMPTLGSFVTGDMVLSRATSLPYTVTAAGSAVRGAPAHFQSPQVVLGTAPLPPGTDIVALFEAARESLDVPGTPGPFEGMVDDPALLDGAELIRIHWFLYGDATTGAVPSVDQITLPFGF